MSGDPAGGKRPSRPHAALAAVVVLAGSGMLIACGDGGEEGAPTVIVPLAAPGC